MNKPPTDHCHTAPASRSVLGAPWRVHAFAWGGVVVLVLLLLGASRHYEGQNIWRGWTESRELRHPGYAERIQVEDFFRTRANTWSNLAFVLVGLYALALGEGDRRAQPPRAGGYVMATPAMSLLFGAACCYLGFGSGLYHASLTRWGQQLDVASMYPPLLACLAMSVGRWLRPWHRQATFRTIPGSTILSVLVVVTSYLLYRYKWSMSARTVLTTLIVSVTCGGLVDAVLARRTLHFRWLLWSTLALVAAIICRQLDVAGQFSGPDAWLQGHALWHVLTALSLACLYAYHRSETTPEPSTTEAAPSSDRAGRP
ncbi:MAG: hypothetical protein EXS32_05115 [Opitutus sp.]|nr:hypothetical protein [Opitutus sp.]